MHRTFGQGMIGGGGGPCLMSVGGGGCTVRSSASWVMVTWGPPLPCKQTNASENITFPQLRWRAVKVNNILHMTLYNTIFDQNYLTILSPVAVARIPFPAQVITGLLDFPLIFICKIEQEKENGK